MVGLVDIIPSYLPVFPGSPGDKLTSLIIVLMVSISYSRASLDIIFLGSILSLRECPPLLGIGSPNSPFLG